MLSCVILSNLFKLMIKSTVYYKKFANFYIPKDKFWGRYHKNRFETFNSLIPKKKQVILDFGCGSAENVITLIRMGHQVVGIDPVIEMVDLGRKNLRQAKLNENIISLGGLTDLPKYKSNSFDIVASLNTLPYLTKNEEDFFFKQARRLIRGRGRIIVSQTNELIDLVTFNKYTVEFWNKKIIPYISKNSKEQKELLRIFSSHLTNYNIPKKNKHKISERDFIRKRRINPISYPQDLLKRHRLRVEQMRFTHFYPMPPQFMESSEKYRDRIFLFERKFKNHPLANIFASIIMFSLKRIE